MKIAQKILPLIGLFAFTVIYAEGEEKKQKWYDIVEFSGFADVYYNYTTNNKTGNTQDTTGTFHQYNKQFQVNAVELDMEKKGTKASPWGLRADFMYGTNNAYQERPYSTTNNVFNMNLLQQAYVQYYIDLLDGLTIDAGKMATHIGNEVLESKDNWNYTIGYIFYNTIPFIHTGARATLAINDRWTGAFFLYNSAQGTGFANPTTGNKPQADVLNPQSLTSGTYHSYNDTITANKALGTQLKYIAIKDRFDIVWNTLGGNDTATARMRNQEYYVQQVSNYSAVQPKPSNTKYDYWFINHIMITFFPVKEWAVRLDWTFGERSGTAAEYSGAYVLDGSNIDGRSHYAVMARDKHDVKRIYNTYGLFTKYQFSDRYTLALRYEYLDDSRYNGVFTANAPLKDITPADRFDLLYMDKLGLRKATNYGQIRTFTLTPTVTLHDHFIIKLDLRMDYGPGRQFVDENGAPTDRQYGAILGAVAKF